MFTDENQKEKSMLRRTAVKQFIKGKNIDDKSFTYFMDIVDDLALCIDLRLGYIENTSNIDKRIINRMYTCGECLLDSDDELNKSFIDSYIDSTIVEYAKFGYEVGLILFKEKLNSFTKKCFNKSTTDYHDAIITLTKKLTISGPEKPKQKTKKLS